MRHGVPSFRDAFVRPLLEGGTALVGDPLRPRDLGRLRRAADRIFDAATRHALLARTGRWMPRAVLDPPGPADVAIFAALHNLLCLAHPDRDRVFARQERWVDLAAMTLAWFDEGAASFSDAPLHLHMLLESVLAARLVGRARPAASRWRRGRARLALVAAPGPERGAGREAARPVLAEAMLPPIAARLRTAFVVRSPWTALLRVQALGEAPLPLSSIGRLSSRPMWRAVCHAWADGPRWIERGGRIMARLGESLRQSFAVEPAARRGAGWVLGALVQVHVLRVWLDDARLGASVDLAAPDVQHFLALPLSLSRLVRVLGDPLVGADPALRRRWDVHVERLRQVVLRDVRREMLDAVVEPVVERT